MIDPALFWNDVAIEVARRDFDPFPGPSGSLMIMPEQGGPTRTSRALAMVHLAMYEAFALSEPAPPSLTPYGLAVAPARGAWATAAIGGAASRALRDLYPRQAPFVSERFANFAGMLLASGTALGDVSRGQQFGEQVFSALAALRQGDAAIVSQPDDKNFTLLDGRHQPDPYASDQGRLNPLWGQLPAFCREAVMLGGAAAHYDHRDYLDPPPDHDPGNPAQGYQQDFDEVKQLGAAGSTTRTVDQHLIGTFWAYDGAWRIGTPPRLYNQCARAVIAALPGAGATLTTPQSLRLLALINMGMADAGIIAWQAKYHYDLWRPVVGIRQQDDGLGYDGGALAAVTASDPFWKPLGMPRTNQTGMFTRTPNFPAYPSGHASFGTTCFEILRRFLKGRVDTGTLSFTVMSEEFDGKNVDPDGSVRSVHHRRLTLAQAVRENIESRIFLGVHWRFDGEGPGTTHGWGGDAIGRKLARRIYKRCLV
ncbi:MULTISPECIES: vanadium-dependent haloperoxidase [Methylobacterium]|uniref:vanadium-dependent haloperoxidase n=1 Tax=Methylobacterium TaxID=407 RepID=UPI0013E9D930|nr:vanadium-dependent haloperoxidase [Methylobacterium sp. DB0501]NGM37838.1 vanadium-dependent haloperoxidase [Methylobacterium sp. DB0501]